LIARTCRDQGALKRNQLFLPPLDNPWAGNWAFAIGAAVWHTTPKVWIETHALCEIGE
jgi:hypothetical protein